MASVPGRVPEIHQLIDEFGRLRASEEEDTGPICAKLFDSLRRTPEELREIEYPLARHQAQGIERSDDLLRGNVVPSTGIDMMAAHQTGVRGLLTNRVRGTYVDRVSNGFDEP